jgi:L-lactate dehydrogenase
MSTRKSKTLGKVVIVGAGDVGSTSAFALAQSGISTEIALFDINENLMNGQVLDLAHGLPFFPPINIHNASVKDYADAQIIVITAGAKQKPNESRINLLQRNIKILESIIEDLTSVQSEAIILVVSNPVDVLTYISLMRSELPKNQVIGSGTVLDTARFRYLISKHCNIDVGNVHAYILGEHGDSEVAAWSMTHLAGMPIDDYCKDCKSCDNWEVEKDKLVEQVRDSAYHIIDYKGATYYAVAMAVTRIAGAIIKNQRSILTVSTYLQGEYGIEDTCLSIPCMISQSGVERIIEANLSESEIADLKKSAEIIKSAIKEIGY